MKAPIRTRIGIGAVLAFVIAGAAILTTTSAGAQDEAIVIPIDTVVRDDEGSRTVLETVNVPVDFQGADCTVSSEAENNSSVHPGNDLIVASGSDSELLLDVEGEPGKVTRASDELTLGATITVTLVMGPDEVFSGGGVVALNCTEPPPPVSTEPPASVSPTSIAPTTTAPPATAEPPAPTTSSIPTQVLPGVQVAPAAQATTGNPSFTG